MKRQHLFRLSHRLYRKSPMILVTSIGSVMISIGLVLTMVIFYYIIKPLSKRIVNKDTVKSI